MNVDEQIGDEESCNQQLECQLHDEGVDVRRISHSISELLVDGAIMSCPRILVKTDSCIIHFCHLIFQLLAFSTGIKISSPWSPTLYPNHPSAWDTILCVSLSAKESDIQLV